MFLFQQQKLLLQFLYPYCFSPVQELPIKYFPQSWAFCTVKKLNLPKSWHFLKPCFGFSTLSFLKLLHPYGVSPVWGLIEYLPHSWQCLKIGFVMFQQ